MITVINVSLGEVIPDSNIQEYINKSKSKECSSIQIWVNDYGKTLKTDCTIEQFKIALNELYVINEIEFKEYFDNVDSEK